jgi:hypothetical protein
MPSISLDPTPKNLQEVIQQDFPSFPQIGEDPIDLVKDPFERIPGAQEKNLMQNPCLLRILSKCPSILRALTRDLGKFLRMD